MEYTRKESPGTRSTN